MGKKYYHIRPDSKFNLGLNELIEYKELLFTLAWRDVKVKYKQSILGIIWVVLQPLALMAIFFFASKNFSLINSSALPGLVFYMCGLLFWQAFSSGVSTMSDSITSQPRMVNKIYFPRLILPVASFISIVPELVILIIILLAIMMYNSIVPNLGFVLFLLIGVIMTVLSAVGVGLCFAAYNVKYRDFRFIVPFFLQASFFINPIFYSYNALDEGAKMFFSINPVASSISALRDSLTDHYPDLEMIFLAFILSFFIFVFGLIVFQRNENQFADNL